MTVDEGARLKKQLLSVRPGKPLHVAPWTEGEDVSVPDEIRLKVDRFGKTLKGYLTASRDLVAGPLAELRPYVPVHMTEACTPTAFLLDDGIIVRYDLVPNPEIRIGVALLSGSIIEWAPRLSELVVHCPRELAGFDPGDQGVTIQLFAESPQGVRRSIASLRIAMVAPFDPTQVQAPQTDRPRPLISVNNEFEIQLQGATVPDDGRPEQGFLVRHQLRAPVGWQAIEVYPQFSPDTWNPEIARLWAEADLLAAVTRHNLREAQFNAIDPHVTARKRMSALLAQLEGHLNGPEEPLQQFITQHPQLLSPAQTGMWPKLPMGNRVTDFVFREPPTDYLLVELERPSHRLFRDDGQPREELVHAMNQVSDWRRYIEDNRQTVQQELGLRGISVNPRALIVIGRRAMLTAENIRKLETMANEMPRLRILTYDDVLTVARATAENILGPLWDGGGDAQIYFLPPA